MTKRKLIIHGRWHYHEHTGPFVFALAEIVNLTDENIFVDSLTYTDDLGNTFTINLYAEGVSVDADGLTATPGSNSLRLKVERNEDNG